MEDLMLVGLSSDRPRSANRVTDLSTSKGTLGKSVILSERLFSAT